MPQQPEPQQPDPLVALAQEADEVLRAARHRMNTIEPQLRRFARAVADLALPVPPNWVEHDHQQVTFSALSPRQFDELIRLLEDLAANRSIFVTRPPGGTALFDVGPAVGPAPAPVVSSVHMSVPR